jgi:hypothetical protein
LSLYTFCARKARHVDNNYYCICIYGRWGALLRGSDRRSFLAVLMELFLA